MNQHHFGRHTQGDVITVPGEPQLGRDALTAAQTDPAVHAKRMAAAIESALQEVAQ